ncbi:DUF975 family protein [Agrilactobacillus yilanensis]|uniref:DUF975 family protein n=1 Tax=Agrilactobacillus yilanensis TaxID=2485997 RepID=A0ABW4JB99_9LACO|nr:DUF975 family protein [Agrilactobacillus yilanensis]
MAISIRDIKKAARAALSGRWVQPIWLLITSYLLTQIVSMMVGGALSNTSFIYFLILMLLNYFVLFAFQYGQFYYPLSVFGKQPFRFSMLFVAFSPLYYKRFVVLNFIKTIFVTLASLLVFIPFIGRASWTTLLNLVFGSYSTELVNKLAKIIMNLSTGTWVLLLTLILLYFLILLFVHGFFQLAAYLVFENAQNPSAHILVSTLFLMRGHWFDLLKLQLSFIILYIFYPVTFLWLIPYRQMSIFVFYLNLKQDFAQRMDQYAKQMHQGLSDDDEDDDDDYDQN